MRTLSFGLWLFIVIPVASCSNESLPPIAKAQPQEVTITQLMSMRERFDHVVVRVIAPCIIAFEGTSLYPVGAIERGDYQRAVGLSLDWPVPPTIQALSEKYILVVGRFDASATGRIGSLLGTVGEVTRIEESSAGAEAEARRKIEEGR